MNLYSRIKRAIRRWLQINLPACRETVAVISESMERPLTIRERVLLRLHLSVCAWCKWYMEHLGAIHTNLQTKPVEPAECASLPGLSDDSRDRLKKKLSGNV